MGKKILYRVGIIILICLSGCTKESMGSSIKAQDESFIFANSDKLKLEEEDIYSLETKQLKFARNEIYARKGHIFKEDQYKAYFEAKAWYKPLRSVFYESLNNVEKYNIGLIQFYELRYAEADKADVEIAQQVKEKDIYESDHKVWIDINGDKIKEEIEYRLLTVAEDGQNAKTQLLINGIGVVFEGTPTSRFAVVDIDKNDNYKEVIVSDYGPSYDYTSKFYSFKEGKIVQIGTTGGIFEDGIEIDENGSFSARTRADILQTWWFDKQYRLNAEHQIEEVPVDFYWSEALVYIKKPFKLYSEKDIKSNQFQVKEGATLTLIGHDNEAWCKARTSSGKEGWFRVEEFCLIPDEKADARQIFIGLNYAD
ncbi:MAG: hypothetical protein K0S30_2221 [Clostridia bacterium]|jgi:hypothetical protein|nr:hypothetical protein [Clostridia bacterium]